jgi:hypothetical protein
MISACRAAGLMVLATNTFPGSIKFGLAIMKKYKQFWVDHPAVRKEQSNYKYRQINGIRLDEPVDNHNHWVDATRMPAMVNLR